MKTKERKPSQCQLIVDYMNRFTWINPLDAIINCGCYRLASRITDLKKKGYLIIDEWMEVPTRTGGTTRVKRYRLAGEEDWQT
jgi:hypothetical protein